MDAPEGKGSTPRPLSRRLLGILLRVLVWFGIVLVGLLGLIWLVVLIFFPDDEIKRMALERVERETGWRVSAAGLDLEIFSGLVLDQVRVQPPPGFSVSPFSIERVVVDYSLVDLLDKKLIVRQVRIERPRLRLEQSGEQTNIEALLATLSETRRRLAASDRAAGSEAGAQSGEPADPFVLDLEQIVVQDAEIEVRLPTCQASVRGLGIAARGKLGGAAGPRLQIELDLTRPAEPNLDCLPGRPPFAVGLDLDLSLDGPGQVDLHGSLSTQGLFAALAGRAAVEGKGAPLTAQLQASLDTAALRLRLDELRLVSAGDELGVLSASLQDFSELNYQVAVPRLSLSQPALAGLIRDLTGLDLTAGACTFSEGRIAGRLRGAGSRLPRLSGRLLAADLALALPQVAIAAVGVGGDLKVAIEEVVERPGPDARPSGSAFRLEGQLHVPGLRVGPRSIQKGELTISAGADLDGRAPLSVSRARVDLSGVIGAAHGGGLNVPRLEFSLNAAAGSVTAGAAGPDLADLTLRTRLRFERLDLSGLALRDFEISQEAQVPRLSASGDGWTAPALATKVSGRTGSLSRAGVQVRGLSLAGDLDGTDLTLPTGPAAGAPRLGQLRIGLTVEGKTVGGGDWSLAAPQIQARLSGRQVQLARRPGRGLDLHLALNAGALRLGRAGQARTIGAKRLGLTANARLTRLDAGIFEGLPASLSLTLADPFLDRGAGFEAFGWTGDLVAAVQGKLDLGRGAVSVRPLDLRLGDLISVSVEADLDWKRKDLEARFSTSEHRLERIVASLPKDVQARIPPLAGGVQVSGLFVGPLIGKFDLRHLPYGCSLKVVNRGVSLTLPGILELAGLSGPVTVSAGLDPKTLLSSKLELTLSRARLIAAGLSAHGLSVDQVTALEGTALRSDGRFGMERVDSGGIWPEPIRGVSFGFASQQHFGSLKDPKSLLQGLKDVRLTEMKLALGSLGAELSGSGQVVILPAATHWSDFRLALTTRARLTAKEPLRLPGGLVAQGGAELSVGLHSAGPGVIRTEGSIGFTGLDLQGKDFALKNVRGAIPVSQFIQIKPVFALLARAVEQPAADARVGGGQSRAYDQALRPLKGQSRSFLIEQARFRDLEFNKLAGNLELVAGVFSLGSLRFGFLDGDVVADTSVVFAPPAARRIDLDAEMSGIDISRLGAFRLAGSSDISGNFRLGAAMKDKDVTVAFNLTRVGRSSLLALLQTVDPQESNPGVVKLKQFLEDYAVSPREVSMHVRHGMAGMRIRMNLGARARLAASFVQGFEGDTFTLPGLPVSGFLNKYLPF